MMSAHLHMWLTLLVRWAHFTFGIAWIGASFYFNWLENHLERNNKPEGIAGDLWAVHGGGFYVLKKYAVAPPRLPTTLHWFMWEAYMTWISGMTLLVIVFYVNAQTYMLSPAMPGMPGWGAITLGLGALLASWVFYDLLCRSRLGQYEWVLALLIVTWFTVLAWVLDRYLSAHAAYIHVGAAMGTVMVANVFRVIIPGQKDMVDAVTEGRLPDPRKGKNALQRSRHNNYFTLPVLFIMISGHYPATYGNAHGWLVLILLALAGVLIRHYFNIRHLPGYKVWPLILSAILLIGLVMATAPQSAIKTAATAPKVTTQQVYNIVQQRCITCHAVKPSHEGFPNAPLGIELDTTSKLLQHAEQVYQAAAINRTMPLGNLTQMTDEERSQIAYWFEQMGSQGLL